MCALLSATFFFKLWSDATRAANGGQIGICACLPRMQWRGLFRPVLPVWKTDLQLRRRENEYQYQLLIGSTSETGVSPRVTLLNVGLVSRAEGPKAATGSARTT